MFFSIRDQLRQKSQNENKPRTMSTTLTMNPYYYQSLHSRDPLQFTGMILEQIITRMKLRAAESAATEQQAAAAQHAFARRAKFNEAMLQLQYKATRTSSRDYRAVWGLAPPVDSRWDSVATVEAWYSVKNQHTDILSHPDNAGRDLIWLESKPIRCECDFDYCLNFCETIGKTEEPA
jgi:hypothetical protein